MRVLVTGGSGFIGSHVVDKLRGLGHEPVIYDLRPSPWHLDGSVDTRLGSITDREALERALHSCDAVAHLAAVADVNDVHAEPEDAERVNARGTVAVLEAARRAGVQRIVYASTIWVYSDCACEAVDEETLLPAPSHLYTSTKLAGELYCKAYQELYGIDYTILRFGIPYGPRAREAAVIPAFVNKAFKGEPLTIAGDGSQSRRFVYVEDLAMGVALAVDDTAKGRVYNLASDETVTIKQIAQTISELVGDVEIAHVPARPGDFGGKIVSSERARNELGWTAGTPFCEGVRRYVEWRKQQAATTSAREAAEVIPAGEPDAEAKPRKVLIAGLYFWAHPGIDLHFVTHPESIEEVERIAGPGSVRWAKPPTAPSFLAARSRADARRALALPAQGKVVAVSGGGWGVGDLLGAARAALQIEDATVLCLCGRNDRLRARVSQELGSEPRLRLMGFTDRMGDVLAASDALIHSSAGLTVLEAIIRGCPVVSYGFGYGHVRASNAALERFGLAQVARRYCEIRPALERALERRPKPDPSFARRPSTASLILTDERRARTLPRWRVRTARAATATATATALALWALSTGAGYSLISHLTNLSPVTAVATTRPEIGLLIDAPNGNVQPLARVLAAHHIHVSFALTHPPSAKQLQFLPLGDQCVPRLPGGGLVRWIGVPAQLHRWMNDLGGGHRHILYASSAPDLGQWWLAHGAGGRLVGGAVKVDDLNDHFGQLRPGEVVEVAAKKPQELLRLLSKLEGGLQAAHLRAVPVARLLHDGTPQT